MSYRALSELHFVPPKQTVTSQYYTEEVLEKSYSTAVSRSRNTGDTLTRKLYQTCLEQFSCKTVLLHTPQIGHRNGAGTTCLVSGPKEYGLATRWI